MLDQLRRVRPLVRAVTVIAVLLLVVQVVIPPAAAAPAGDDDELSVAPSPHEDEEAAEPVHDADEEDAAQAPDDAEPAEDGDAAADEPIHEGDEEGGTPAPDEEQPVAEPEPAHEGAEAADEPAPVEEVAAAAPVYDDPVADGFLLRLLDAINARRARLGTQRLSYVPARANVALDGFLAETFPAIRWPGPCGHHVVGGAISWDYVTGAGFGGDPRGEVIACPGPEPYWTPDRAAEQWWHSPIHFDVLYADGYSNSIACSAQGVSGRRNRRGGSSDAASAVLCVTFRS